MIQALEPVRRTRYARSGAVRENEVLRVAAIIGGADDAAAAETARREILAWAQNRSGGKLPAEAWGLRSFDYLSGGRNSSAVRLVTANADLWALRAEDPDRTVPGRVWTTEVVVANASGLRPRLSVRLIAHTAEEEFFVEPHTPGFVLQLAERCGLHDGTEEFIASPRMVRNDTDADALLAMLLDPARTVPVFALSSETPDALHTTIDAQSLARATLGLGHVAILSPSASWRLTNRVGQHRSVHSGAARIYMPGFNDISSPFDHRLILGQNLKTSDQTKRTELLFRSISSKESIRQNKIGQNILSFATVRLAHLKFVQDTLASSGASDEERLKAAEARISALENDLETEKSAQEFFALEADNAEERAQAAEAQHRASSQYIQHLQQQLSARGELSEDPLPTDWSQFSSWCDTSLAGRVCLAPAARRNVRAPLFEDVAVAARCVNWLATSYREGRINGSTGDFVDFPIENGIRNAACGGDEFDFMWEGRRYTADWHVKNGGNTRDPRACLRIYYTWDEDSQQVIIADLPAHKTTSAS